MRLHSNKHENVSQSRITAAGIVQGLGGKDADGKCRCPVCGHTTLTVGTGRTGKPIVHCHHPSCGNKRELIAALGKMGLWGSSGRRNSRTFEPSPQASQFEAYQKFKKARAILYRATDGSDLARKYFNARGIGVMPCVLEHPDKPGLVFPVIGIEKGHRVLKGCAVIYLELDSAGELVLGPDGKPVRKKRFYGPIKGGFVELARGAKDEPLIVTEGIETGLAAMEVSGLPAIAALGSGMKGVIPLPAEEYLIAADNDQPGRDNAGALRARLEAEGRTARIVMPSYKGKDWADVLEEEGPERAADSWRKAVSRADKVEAARPQEFCSWEDFMEITLPKREMLMGSWLPKPGLAMLFGIRGTSKTFLAMDIAMHVARGESFLGWECKRPARVLYVDGELPGSLLQERMRLYGLPPRGTIQVAAREHWKMRRESIPDLHYEEDRARLKSIIERSQAEFIILDSLTTLAQSAEESSAEDWAPIQSWLMDHRDKGRTILFIHHAGKNNTQRGTSRREDVVETSIRLTKLGSDTEMADDETAYRLEFVKGRELFGDAEQAMLLRLAVRNGRATWSHVRERDEQAEQIAAMLAGNMTHKDIAKELGVSRQAVFAAVKRKKLNEKVVRLADYKRK